MNIIVGSHGSGRSAEILKKANEDKAILSTRNPGRAMAEAYILKYKDVQIMPHSVKAIEQARAAGRKLYIDDLEAFVKALTSCELAGFSLIHCKEDPVLVREMKGPGEE